MTIRLIAAVGLALFASVAALAGSCNCKPEITNASAKVTSTCSKIWSSNHCTLKEAGASGSRLNEQFRDRLSDGTKILADTLGQINLHGRFDGKTLDYLAEELSHFEYIRRVRGQCLQRAQLDMNSLVMMLIDPVLHVANDDTIGWLLDPNDLSSVIDDVIEHNVANDVCASDDIEQQYVNGRTIHFGAGCLAHGDASAYVITNLANFADCTESIAFP